MADTAVQLIFENRRMRVFSGRYGARTLSPTVACSLRIKIGACFFVKTTLNFLRLLFGGPSRVPVNPSQI
jgi:hypothetical protein